MLAALQFDLLFSGKIFIISLNNSKLLLDKGKAISVADRFVILASQLMRYCVNNRLNYAKTKGIIEAAHPELVSSSNTYQETFFGSL